MTTETRGLETLERRKSGRPRVRSSEERRMKILDLFCTGNCFKRIALIMELNPGVVSNDITRLMQRYGVATHAQLGVYVERHRVFEKPGDGSAA